MVEVIAVGLLYVPIPPNPDQELYDYMAWSARHQGSLYRAAGDVNMPGEPLLHVLSMATFGNHYWSYRLQDYLLLVAFTAAVALMVRRYFGNLYGYLFVGFYLLAYTTAGYWMAGQRDLLATHFVTLAGFAYLRRVDGGTRGWLLAASLSLAFAALLKPTFLIAGPMIVLAGLPFGSRGIGTLVTDVVIMAAVGAFALGGVALAGWATGSIGPWYEMTVTYSLSNYVGGVGWGRIVANIASTVARSWHWYSIMALAGLICWMLQPPKAPLVMILVSAATVLISTLTQRKGFGYHFGGLLAPATMLCTFYLATVIRLSRLAPDLRTRLAVLSFPILMVVFGLESKAQKELASPIGWYLGLTDRSQLFESHRFLDVYRTAALVRSATTPEQTVWTISTHLMINSLAERRIPSPLANLWLLRCDRPSPLTDRWRHEAEETFRDNPPELIVLEAPNPSAPNKFINMDAIRPHEPIAPLADSLEHSYVEYGRIGRFAIFARRDSRVRWKGDVITKAEVD